MWVEGGMLPRALFFEIGRVMHFSMNLIQQCKPEIFKSWLPLILIIKRNETQRVVKRVGKKEAHQKV